MIRNTGDNVCLPMSGMLVDRFDNHGLALYLTGGLLLSSTLIEVFSNIEQRTMVFTNQNSFIFLSFRYLLLWQTSFMRDVMDIHSWSNLIVNTFHILSNVPMKSMDIIHRHQKQWSWYWDIPLSQYHQKKMEEQWGDFLGRVEWEGGGFERFWKFLGRVEWEEGFGTFREFLGRV